MILILVQNIFFVTFLFNFRPALSGKKLRLVMCGIDIMNDEFSEVDILYGKVNCKNDDVDLQEFADSINAFFYKKGINYLLFELLFSTYIKNYQVS